MYLVPLVKNLDIRSKIRKLGLTYQPFKKNRIVSLVHPVRNLEIIAKIRKLSST